MAKKHTKKKRRHHRVGGMGGGKVPTWVKFAAVGAGFLFGEEVNAAIDKVNTHTTSAPGATPVMVSHYINSPITLTLVEAGVGGAAAFLGPKRGIMGWVAQAGGGVLAGAGVRRFLKSQGMISGYQHVPVIGRRRGVHGYQAMPVIGSTPSQLAGMPAQLAGGYRVNGGYVPHGSGPRVVGCTDPGSAAAYVASGMN